MKNFIRLSDGASVAPSEIPRSEEREDGLYLSGRRVARRKDPAAQALGKKGGAAKSEAKTKANRGNARKPRKRKKADAKDG